MAKAAYQNEKLNKKYREPMEALVKQLSDLSQHYNEITNSLNADYKKCLTLQESIHRIDNQIRQIERNIQAASKEQQGKEKEQIKELESQKKELENQDKEIRSILPAALKEIEKLDIEWVKLEEKYNKMWTDFEQSDFYQGYLQQKALEDVQFVVRGNQGSANAHQAANSLVKSS